MKAAAFSLPKKITHVSRMAYTDLSTKWSMGKESKGPHCGETDVDARIERELYTHLIDAALLNLQQHLQSKQRVWATCSLRAPKHAIC